MAIEPAAPGHPAHVEDVRAARPYLFTRNPLQTLARRIVSIAALVANEVELAPMTLVEERFVQHPIEPRLRAMHRDRGRGRLQLRPQLRRELAYPLAAQAASPHPAPCMHETAIRNEPGIDQRSRRAGVRPRAEIALGDGAAPANEHVAAEREVEIAKVLVERVGEL